jgi:hypothetical protein
MNPQDTISEGPPPNARLVAQQGPEQGQTFAIPRAGLLVGRTPECDVALKDSQVSRQHARLSWRGSRLIIEDLGSANGTLVNGMPISQPFMLSEHDRLQLGDSVFVVQGLMSRELTPTVRNLDAAAAAAPRVQPPPAHPPAKPQQGILSWLALAGLPFIGVIIVGLLVLAAVWYYNQPNPASQVPTVSFITPTNGAQVSVGAPVIVQANASDARGVTRIELWVNGTLTGQQTSATPQGQPTLLLNVNWTPPAQGSHVLEVRAFNIANQQNLPVVITVNATGVAATPAAGGLPTPTQTATPTPPSVTPLPTATSPSIIIFTPTPTPLPATPTPSLQAVTDVNVRSGPSTSFQVLGLLRANETVPVVGRSADGAWWQIVYPPNSSGVAWVVGTYVRPSAAADNAPVVAGPALPPTPTAAPPTATNTAVPSAEVSFTADRTELLGGQCTRLRWRVSNVIGYYIDNIAGAGDEGNREVCDPVGTNTHTLRIQRQDGSTQDFIVTITVRPSSMPKPSQDSPDDGDEFSNGDEVDFDWSSVSAPGTVTYNLEVQYKDDGEWKNWRTLNGLNKSEYELDDFPDDKSGRWRVWATSSELGDSERTEWWDFDFDE